MISVPLEPDAVGWVLDLDQQQSRLITGGFQGVGADVGATAAPPERPLVLTDIDATALAALAAELGEDRVLTAVADVRDLAAMQAVADWAVDRFGGIDVVVANAGIAPTVWCVAGRPRSVPPAHRHQRQRASTRWATCRR